MARRLCSDVVYAGCKGRFRQVKGDAFVPHVLFLLGAFDDEEWARGHPRPMAPFIGHRPPLFLLFDHHINLVRHLSNPTSCEGTLSRSVTDCNVAVKRIGEDGEASRKGEYSDA